MQNRVIKSRLGTSSHCSSSCPSALGRWSLASLVPWNRAPRLPQKLRMDRDRLFELLSGMANGMPMGAGDKPSIEIDALVGRLAGK